MSKMKIVALAAALALGACSQARDVASEGRDKTKEGNDVVAGVLVEAPCAMSLGAWGRLESDRRRKAVFELCVEPSAAGAGSR